jgi:pyruvate formate lyase activating enzyme
LGKHVPLHFSAFHPDFKLTHLPRTPAATCQRASEQARRHGIHYVYSGNIHDPRGQSTYCPSCGELLIERDWYVIGDHRLDANRCSACRATIAGRFQADGVQGGWGRRRRRLGRLLR